MDNTNTPIYIFYAMYCIADCLDRFVNTFIKIEKSGLLNKTDKIYIVLCGPDKNKLISTYYTLLNINCNKIKLIIKDNKFCEFETLNLIWQKSSTENFKCLYLHSKGVSHFDKPNDFKKNVESWIENLEYICIEKHESCIDNLNYGTSCGSEYKTEPLRHFDGNFWWSKSDYIKTLTNPINFVDDICLHIDDESKRSNIKFWIAENSNSIPITLNQSFDQKSLYYNNIPRHFYEIQPQHWPYDLLNVPSAWIGLENYILSIIKNFNLKTNCALEFGVDYGFSTYILSKIFKSVIGVDAFLSDIHIVRKQGDDFYYETKQNLKNTNVDLYRLDYQSFIKNNNDKFDLIHIDIVHLYEQTYQCAEWAINHSNLVILHDTCEFPEVHSVCRDLSLKYKLGFTNIDKHYGLGILYKL